jgi:hypothetical protein
MPTLVGADTKNYDSKLHGQNLFQKDIQNHDVFSFAQKNIRIINTDLNRVYKVSKTHEIEQMSKRGRSLLSQLRSDEVDESVSQFDDEDLQDQLEALGYK